MRYAPYAQEVAATADMSETLLLEYFLTRVFETEEVWGLDDGCEWITVERDHQSVMPIWPYRQYAAEACDGEWSAHQPAAESLEDFVYNTLGTLIEEDIMLEVMSGAGVGGCLIAPQRLYEIFTGMFSAGEYTLDS